MQVVSSSIDSQIPQIDGKISVIERHIYDDGSVYLHPYFAEASWNLQEIAEQRKININAAIVLKEAQLTEAMNFEVPLSKTDFRDRFTLQEQIAIDNFNATYQANPALTAEQKAAILSALQHWADTTKVYLGLQKTIDMVNMYETLGLIGVGRAAEVLTI